jgi:glutamate decarboxylase
MMPKNREAARANLENLYRIFTVPEAPDSTLGAIDQAITDNVTGFLQTHIVAIERNLEEIEADFSASTIPEEPTFVSEYTEFVKEKLVAQSVHTAAPGFIGHMTSALPYFMLPLSRIMTALNQNLVKVETSKAFTPMERQVLAMLHRLVYRGDDAFYQQWVHNSQHALGAFCSGGTIANVTALWVARNRLFAPAGAFRGIAQEGLARSLKHLGCDGGRRPGLRRGHYSLGKAADLLGIGRDNLVMVDTDANNRIDMRLLKQECRRLQERTFARWRWSASPAPPKPATSIRWRRWPIWPPSWAATFMSMPPGAGRPSFPTATATARWHRAGRLGHHRCPQAALCADGGGDGRLQGPHGTLSAIEHHAAYILRHGSKDLGSHTLEGSRPGKAMLVHAGLSIIGRKGYELLIDLGIERARTFAGMIRQHPDFELTSEPELNILTYRYCPPTVQQQLAGATAEQCGRINAILDQVNQLLQKHQREAGRTFVSRTRLRVAAYGSQEITVLRVVLANPLTTDEILAAVLAEQCEIVQQPEIRTPCWSLPAQPPGLASPLQPSAAGGLLIHGVHADAAAIAALAGSGHGLVLCPRSNSRFGVARAPVAACRRAGVPLALGTDSRASSPSLSVWDELAFARSWFGGALDPQDWLEIATVGGATVLGLADRLGRLQPGCEASFQVVAVPPGAKAATLAEALCAAGTEIAVQALLLGGENVLPPGPRQPIMKN